MKLKEFEEGDRVLYYGHGATIEKIKGHKAIIDVERASPNGMNSLCWVCLGTLSLHQCVWRATEETLCHTNWQKRYSSDGYIEN